MTEITHIVTNGCSWTYCQGLENPHIDGWPRLLANKLDLKVVNLAVPGSSNAAIHRRSYEYILSNLSTNTKPLVIIGWSQFWRQEAWYEYDGTNLTQDYKTISKPNNYDKLDDYQRCLLTHWNDEDHFRKTMLYKSSLISLFKSLNIPYLMSDFSGSENLLKIKKLKSKFSYLDKFVYDQYHIKDFYNICKGSSLLPCGHYGLDGQVTLSNYIFEEINNLLDIKTINNSNFLTLKEHSIQKNFKSVWNYF